MRGGREGERLWGCCCCCCFVGTWWNWGLLGNEISRCCKERPDRCTVTFLNLETPKGEDFGRWKTKEKIQNNNPAYIPLACVRGFGIGGNFNKIVWVSMMLSGLLLLLLIRDRSMECESLQRLPESRPFRFCGPFERDRQTETHTHTETLLEENISSRATQKPLSFHNFNGLGFLFFPGQLGSP